MNFSRFIKNKQTMVLAFVLLLQATATIFFTIDAISDIITNGINWHTLIEMFVSIFLVIGFVFGTMEMRRSIRKLRRSEEALSAARGAFFELITAYFKRWNLTKSEREVALLAIKGFDIAEISKFRGVAQGTVRAQLSNLYSKAGVSNRTELLSVFVDELLDKNISL